MINKTKVSFSIILLIFATWGLSGSTPKGGEKLYNLKCGRCHTAYQPQKYSIPEWKTIIQDMGPLSGLNEESEKLILDYLGESAKKKEGGLPTTPVLAGYIYTEYFSSKDSTDTFDIHYLNLNISGRLHQRVSYKAEFELEHGGGAAEPPFVEQAYLDLWLFRNSGLRIGAFLTPFNRFDDFHGPLENLMITRPKMSREIGVSAWKEVGINFHGNLYLNKNLHVNYDAYVINGLGNGSRLRKSRHYRDNNDAKSFGIRVSGVFHDKFEAGGSYYFGAWNDEGDLDLKMMGLHFLGKIGDMDIFAEYSKAISENPLLIDDGEANGYFIQASYLLDKKFRPSIRYGTLDYLDNGDLLGRKPTDYDNKVWALGFNYYLTPSIVFKIEYNIVQEGKRKEGKENNVLAFQAAVRF